MARRAIREYDAKRLLARYLPDYLPGFMYPGKIVLVEADTDWDRLATEHPWLLTDRLVAKPDQLFGKRGKHGLLGLNLDYAGAKAWIGKRMRKEVTVGKTTDKLAVFMIEPFVPHDQDDEMFIAIRTEREQDVIYFSLQGGIDIEENWDSVVQIPVPVLGTMEDVDVAGQLPDFDGKDAAVAFITALYKFFVDFSRIWRSTPSLWFTVIPSFRGAGG